MQRPRTPSKLSDSVHHQLNMYALAASAAGVGVLALAPLAEARIVYTPANEILDVSLPLDLNHDGINDFILRTFNAHFTYSLAIYTQVPKNEIWGAQIASALHPGVRIGPNKHFSHGHRGTGGSYGKLMWRHQVSTFTNHSTGQWKPPITNHHLGFRFIIKGKIHYGWARLSDLIDKGATLTGYAYETIPNKPIIAGKTHGTDVVVRHATLGELAAGRK